MPAPFRDISEYGIYIHVPNSSELLVLAESLVRSFQLRPRYLRHDNQNSTLQPTTQTGVFGAWQYVFHFGLGYSEIQLGKLLLDYGVTYIAEQLRLSPHRIYLSFPDAGIDRRFGLTSQHVFASDDLMISSNEAG